MSALYGGLFFVFGYVLHLLFTFNLGVILSQYIPHPYFS